MLAAFAGTLGYLITHPLQRGRGRCVHSEAGQPGGTRRRTGRPVTRAFASFAVEENPGEGRADESGGALRVSPDGVLEEAVEPMGRLCVCELEVHDDEPVVVLRLPDPVRR